MEIDHIAIWSPDIERLKDYYVRYFEGIANSKYINPKTQLQSYFISFEASSRIEIMTIPEMEKTRYSSKKIQGYTHLAFAVNTMKEVDLKAQELEANGYEIVRGPRVTGDGYYEFETLDPDNNKIEVTAKYTEDR
ncbi:MAG: VOC family protein [Bacteroidales bacterium]